MTQTSSPSTKTFFLSARFSSPPPTCRREPKKSSARSKLSNGPRKARSSWTSDRAVSKSLLVHASKYPSPTDRALSAMSITSVVASLPTLRSGSLRRQWLLRHDSLPKRREESDATAEQLRRCGHGERRAPLAPGPQHGFLPCRAGPSVGIRGPCARRRIVPRRPYRRRDPRGRRRRAYSPRHRRIGDPPSRRRARRAGRDPLARDDGRRPRAAERDVLGGPPGRLGSADGADVRRLRP